MKQQNVAKLHNVYKMAHVKQKSLPEKILTIFILAPGSVEVPEIWILFYGFQPTNTSCIIVKTQWNPGFINKYQQY